MKQYSKRSAVLHMLVFVLLVCALMLGYELAGRKDEMSKLSLYPVHFLFGSLALMLNLVRLSYKDSDDQPKPANASPWLSKIATVTHRLLNYSVFAVVVSGILTLGVLWLIAMLQQVEPGMVQALEKIDVKQFHELFIWMLIALVALHFIAALYHQFVMRDNILRRMAIKRYND